ncbi:Tex family protein [Liquorilactobacillus capillatus]|uniref:Transcription accessory protein n=1 Tax=Liquorilactobacillus capillatus DSM 19910 TaxID=1423731 RepID=A0A0R1M405_9LACO|nr:Tex family protein [Liquorilactobacillus capillatus]KRL02784.1 transcription accessory protein [Liquorilactobacillus capillatus DSM 19910]
MKTEIEKAVAQKLKISYKYVHAALELLHDGNTVPFIARYRKERTASMDEVVLRKVWADYQTAEKLDIYKQKVITTISEQGKLTKALQKQISGATVLQTVEDLYLPFKKKRKTRATVAKEAGLAGFADWLLHFPQSDIEKKAAAFITPVHNILQVEDVIAGAQDIIAEVISEKAIFRAYIRKVILRTGTLVATVKDQAKDENGVFRDYYQFEETLTKLPTYRTLALDRGEKLGILNIKIQSDEDYSLRYLHSQLILQHKGPAVKLIIEAYTDGFKRLLKPSLEREVRNDLTKKAHEHAIEVFGDNLYHLLMQAPLKGKVTLGFDPAYRTGCKLAVVDPTGKFIAKAVIYPHARQKGTSVSEEQYQKATSEFENLLRKYQVEMIAIGNGTASRESEQFVAQVIKRITQPIYYVIVSEAGASVYSASKIARSEFPEFNVEERSAISIARRLQDPLAELIKIDPQAIGVGQYQHDLPQVKLKERLAAVIETAVNQVGVDLNTASVELLRHIAGLNAVTAANIVKYRNENGVFTSRADLKKVERLGPKAYIQAAGFLHIIGGNNVLDNTDIHPESYPLTKKILGYLGMQLKDIGSEASIKTLSKQDSTILADKMQAGQATVADILRSLQKPGRDIREELPVPLLRQDVLKVEDLNVGMKLQGTVRNVVDFGAFMDIGVKQDGLVHISKLTNKFIQRPHEVVAVGDIVTVWIESVDLARQRIQLTMLAPDEGAAQ